MANIDKIIKNIEEIELYTAQFNEYVAKLRKATDNLSKILMEDIENEAKPQASKTNFSLN